MGHQLSPEDRRLLQLEELKIWQDFHCFCEKNNLTYYFTAGSLLGAVRHKGFIPWDDDIDIAMPRKDYDRTADLWAKEPIAGYCFQNSFTEPNFPYYFSKIRKHGTEVYEPFFSKINMHKGIYIDIFPLDPCPSIESLAKLYFKAMEVITSAISPQVNPDFSRVSRKWYMLFLYHIFRRIPHLWLIRFRDDIRKIVSFFSNGKRLCTVGGAHGYPHEAYYAKWFQHCVFLSFEGKAVPAPAGWNELLRNMYGDYMTPPNISQRQGHFQNFNKETEEKK